MFKDKSYNYLLLLIITTLLFISFLLFILLNINNDKKLISSLENSIQLTKNLLEEQKRYALSISLLISEDKEFIDSFNKQDRIKTFEILNRKIEKLKIMQNSIIEIQVHDLNLNTFIRTWDISKKDIPLSSFRKGLVKVKKNLTPISSIELGKRLNIKAISPIIENNEFKGSIEVIIGFDYLQKELMQRAYQPYILLNRKYLDIATELKNNKKIADFVLVNDINQDISFLEEINFKDYGYFTNKDKAFSYFTLYSMDREKLGYIVISIKNDDQISINNSFEKKIQNTNTAKVIIE